MENMWLMAHSLGISLHIVSSFNDGAIEIKAKRILGIPTNLKIAFTCRLGYTSASDEYLRVDKLGFMSLGCVMENMWLMAHSLGINFHIVSSFNDGTIESKAKRILGIPTNLKIAFTCRLGYASASDKYLRVRRDVKDFTSYNQYGNKYIS